MKALKEKKWGDFHAIFRPYWNTGGEMGQWNEEMISLLPSTVKVFASAGAGYNWADVDVLAKYGVYYCNGAGASSEAVADMAIFHILSVFRNLTWSHLAARSGDPERWWDAHKYVNDTAHNPRGHTIGIIGLGNIGYLIAWKAYVAFGVKIVYNDILRKSREREESIQAVYYEKLEDMLAVADCVVIATPFSGEKIVTAQLLAKFKKGSRLVNIARGGLVDSQALADALESRHIFAAGLDVFENEPYVHPRLIENKKYVTLTCHNAGGAIETNYRFESLAMENVSLVLSGKEPLTPVNKQFFKT
ncbi:hypothetical protein V1520DRAFT_371961 [Lipomyces starkeyi]|uniref:D-isomer specific 2-hydroxyacid dehydrogenase NAD-binding domain-containing protein n=1 Tax=Lipomyces starkeyi NRRL Y-11557 TaxID=675824 RepID=A0A1E3QGG5_LIPST|nr:hypothetical protein LIPSTDRAFT_66921 [Lipomyces starkeyi NRRL Y-11557]